MAWLKSIIQSPNPRSKSAINRIKNALHSLLTVPTVRGALITMRHCTFFAGTFMIVTKRPLSFTQRNGNNSARLKVIWKLQTKHTVFLSL